MPEIRQLTSASTGHARPCAGARQLDRARSHALAAAATGIAIAVAAGLTGCSGSAASGPAASTSSAAASTPGAAQPGKSGSLPGVGDPAIYWTTMQQQLAVGLHTSIGSLTRYWDSNSGSRAKNQGVRVMTTILDVATEHGISQAGLRSLELAAIQQACAVLERDHRLATQQARARMQEIRGWAQSDLDGYAMYAFQQR
jgi:hypothetical protein